MAISCFTKTAVVHARLFFFATVFVAMSFIKDLFLSAKWDLPLKLVF